jgi:hypothetical protein
VSLTAAAIRLMASKGLTADDIADIAESMETTGSDPAISKAALRTRKWREKQAEPSQNVTGDVTETRHGDVSHVGERTQVVTPSLPSLRSEELRSKKTPGIPIGIPRPLSIKPVRSDDFADFWAAYPNKSAKLKAEAAYAKALKRIVGPDPPGQILAGVERAKLSRQWSDGFIPHPATWLNGGCWEDQPAETIPRQNHERSNRNEPTTGRAAFRGILAEMVAEERGLGAGDLARTG